MRLVIRSLCLSLFLIVGINRVDASHVETVKRVIVLTTNTKDGGTDASVYLKVFGRDVSGQEHATADMLLDNKKNNFESGQRDEFVFTGKAVGQVTKIRLRHDNKGKKPGWHVESVTLAIADGTEQGREMRFDVNRWLASDEEEGALCVEVYPEGDTSHNLPVACH